MTKEKEINIEKEYENDYIEVFPDLEGTENLLNVTFAPGENLSLKQTFQGDHSDL